MSINDCVCVPEASVLFGPGRGPADQSAKFKVTDKPVILRLFDSSGEATISLYTCTTVCDEVFSAPAVQNCCPVTLDKCTSEVLLFMPGQYFATVEGADPEDIVLEYKQVDTQVSLSQNGAVNMSCNKIDYACDPSTGALTLTGGTGGVCTITPGDNVRVVESAEGYFIFVNEDAPVFIPANPDRDMSFTSNADGTTTFNVGGSSVTVGGKGVRDFEYEPTNGRLWITLLDGTEHEVTITPASEATSVVPGLVRLAVSGEYAQKTNDNDAATPAYVETAIASRIPTVIGSGAVAVAATPVADHTQYTVSVATATGTVAGVAPLATGPEYPQVGDTQATTPDYVAAAINNAVAALPGDKFLQGLQSYNPTTNVMTLLMNDGSTVPVDLTGLMTDAMATIPDWIPQAVPSAIATTEWGHGSVVNAVNNAAMSEAELTNANALNAATSVNMMAHVLGNSANEGPIDGVLGVRNADGSMGYKIKFAGSLANSAAANLVLMKTVNGGYFGLGNATNGAVFNLPVAPYDDYVMEIGGANYATLGEFGEVILRAASGFATGIARRSNHAIRNTSGVTDIILRAEERIKLHYIAGDWRVVVHNHRQQVGAGWWEADSGEAYLDFTFTNEDNIPAGENLTYDVDLPIKMGSTSYLMSACDRNMSIAMPLGLAPNAANDSGGITFQHVAFSSTSTKARFVCRNNTGTLYPGMGTVYYHGNGGIDFADLGGIASY